MYCPKCRSEYREGFSECGRCEVALVAELPPLDTFASPETMAAALAGKDVQAFMVGNHVALLDVQHYLAQERIPSVVAGEAEQEVESALHARFFLMLAREDLERAAALMKRRWRDGVVAEGLLLTEAPPPEGACPACGAAVSTAVSECPDCGLFLGDAEAAQEQTGADEGQPPTP